MIIVTDRIVIRRAVVKDGDALAGICVRTADSGDDATAYYGDPVLPGLIWALPYLERPTAHAFVLEAGGEAVGYVVGAADTRSFEADLDQTWWPQLQQIRVDQQSAGARDAHVLALIANPPHSRPDILADYPAHLHINILPGYQAGGWGRRLIETIIASVSTDGAHGIHLGVSPTNKSAIGFYRHIGFRNIDPNDASLMGKPLS